MILYVTESKPKKVYLKESSIQKVIGKSFLNEAWRYSKKKEEPVYFSMDDEIKLAEDPLSRIDKEKQSGKPRNFPIERNGKQYWVSRSSTISLYVFCQDDSGEWNVLVNQRGAKMQYGGKWNVVSGFLDYGETLESAAARECYEECGINLNGCEVIDCGSNSDELYGPVNHRFACVLDGNTKQHPPTIEHCEGYGTEMQEVQNVAWIPISKIDGLNMRYSQKQTAKSLINKLVKNENGGIGLYKDLLDKLYKLVISGSISKEKYTQIINILNK